VYFQWHCAPLLFPARRSARQKRRGEIVYTQGRAQSAVVKLAPALIHSILICCKSDANSTNYTFNYFMMMNIHIGALSYNILYR
jgi:hypothetical protein